MPPFQVVILSPGFNDLLGAVQTDEDVVVQAFFAEFAIEALDICVLNRVARLNEPELDAVLLSPQVKRLADEFRPVVNGDDIWEATGHGNSIKCPGHPLPPCQGMVDFKYGAFTAKVIYNGKYPEASAVVEAVRDEIHGPVLIDPIRPVHDHPEMAGALPTFLQAQREAFLAIDTRYARYACG